MFDFLERQSMPESQLIQLPPLVLAYIGDAVYEVFVRTYIIDKGIASVNKLHKMSIGFVSAKAQSAIVKKMMDLFTAEEQDIIRRGRNAKSATIPKNVSVTDYRLATGFEALIGWLYLKKDLQRLKELIDIIIKINTIDEGNSK